MGRVWMGGAEVGIPASGTAFAQPDADSNNIAGTGVSSRDTSVFRSGQAAYKFVTGATATSQAYIGTLIDPASGTEFYYRAYMRFDNLPSVACIVAGSTTLAANGPVIVLNTDGTMQMETAVGVVGSPSAAITTGVWYRIEFYAKASGASDIVEFRIDGTTISGTTAAHIPGAPNGIFNFGWINTAAASIGANLTMYVDDCAVNGIAGATNISWPGEGKVLLAKPSSDSQVGTWTGGAGGVTNLWDAVSNTPPIGTAAETNLTQIESTDSSGDNATDEYRGNCGSYTTLGVGATDTVDAIQAWANHGEDVATGTKTGSFGLQANPSQAYVTFTFGADIGALGTYPTNWRWNRGTMENVPTVTLGSDLIIAIRKTDAGTRVASCDALMAYVGVQTASAVYVPRNPAINHSNPALV